MENMTQVGQRGEGKFREKGQVNVKRERKEN